MTKAIEIIKLPRVHLLDVVKDLSIEQLNHIPDGFNNNIIWNLAHIVATQQNICYKRAGLDITRMNAQTFTAYFLRMSHNTYTLAVLVSTVMSRSPSSLCIMLSPMRINSATIGGWSKYPQSKNREYIQ